MRTRVSSLLAGVFVVAIAVTGCASSTTGEALGLDDPVSATPQASASSAVPVPSTPAPDASASPAQEQPMLAAAAPVGYRIGDTGPGGGIVFYDAGSPREWGQYLEAAPAGWNGSPRDSRVRWCDRSSSIPTGSSIGDGAANTQAMLEGCPSGAANTVRDYAGGGKADWFLPSLDELNALRAQQGSVGGLAPYAYWSSSEDGADYARYQVLADGRQNFTSKAKTLSVRPVRAF